MFHRLLSLPSVGRFEYFRDPGKTAASYRGDYFTLGDIGHVDEESFLYLTDRSADVLISGGVNVYPAEIDAVLLEHPAVGDAAVIGEPDPNGVSACWRWSSSNPGTIDPRSWRPN
jgi:long-chain acyl-CoA synthetase